MSKMKETLKKKKPPMMGIPEDPEMPEKEMACGGKVHKKKGYKKGGKVRGSGCATKGVKPCKMC